MVPIFASRGVQGLLGLLLISSGCSDDKSPSPSSAEAAPLGPTADVEVTGHVFKVPQLAAPDVSTLSVPAGFSLSKAASGLGNARMIAVADDGTIYVTRRDEGDVLMLKEGDNGELSAPVVAASRPGAHGLALYEGKAYIATPHEIFRAEVLEDGSFGPLEMIIHDLPDAGQHNTRTVQIGPDGMMYISVGSTCNECNEPNPENATMLRASLDGKQRSVWASGLRDTIGWGWQPQTGSCGESITVWIGSGMGSLPRRSTRSSVGRGMAGRTSGVTTKSIRTSIHPRVCPRPSGKKPAYR